jgi:transketolase
MVHGVQSGHPGGSMGCADFMTALYFEIMHHQPHPFSMDGIGEDIFILSNGHISPVFYSVLARSGYFPIEELATFRKLNSRLQGHPATHEGLPGVRVATGSLGQGMSVAIGVALAKKLNNDNRLVFSLHGDGELEEGQNWEALMFAPNKKVDNLIITIDHNGQQIDGPTSEIMSLGDLDAKLKAFGWKTLHADGNDMPEIVKTLHEAKKNAHNGFCQAIIMDTVMGKGVDFMENDHKWHGVAPSDEQLKNALAQLQETIGDY